LHLHSLKAGSTRADAPPDLDKLVLALDDAGLVNARKDAAVRRAHAVAKKTSTAISLPAGSLAGMIMKHLLVTFVALVVGVAIGDL
jgi:uncharacterized membrane protein